MTGTVIASRTCGGHFYEIDTDRERLDLPFVHDFLANCSHWARGIPLDVLRRAIENSLAFGLYRDAAQIGFARVVSDRATFAYLADVFVIAEERHNGLGQWLVETLLARPPLHGLRRWLLVTRDAASLYRRCGFTDLQPGFAYLERFDGNSYSASRPRDYPGPA
ncbi:MAG TPA: GNAT family N-acetyltransferase [Stellaceae bacterium]|nr:GNAT family N-acetyltransferase [Stellaceae bacterium]